MKKLILILTAITALLLNTITPVYAAKDYYLIGDVDLDDTVTILDATRIQRNLAGLRTLGSLERYLADTDGDRSVTILDSTDIQRVLAGIKSEFCLYKLRTWSARIDAIEADADCSALAPGTTVTFSIIDTPRIIPTEYDIYVDGILIIERTIERSFSYPFVNSGSYHISVAAHDPFGGADVYTLDVTVLHPYEPPVINGTVFNRSTMEISVTASGGTEPYEYQYTIHNHIEPPAPGDVYATDHFDLMQDENGEWVLRCRFCSESTVHIPLEKLSTTLSYYCEVQVRDAAGTLSEIRQVQIVL